VKSRKWLYIALRAVALGQLGGISIVVLAVLKLKQR